MRIHFKINRVWKVYIWKLNQAKYFHTVFQSYNFLYYNNIFKIQSFTLTKLLFENEFIFQQVEFSINFSIFDYKYYIAGKI